MIMFKKYSLVYILYSIILIVIPLVFIIIFALTSNRTIDFSNFSLEYVAKVFEPMYLTIILRSVKIALVTTLITLVLGYICAYFITKVNVKYQHIVLVLFIVPMWMNALLRTYAWKSILNYNGILNQLINSFGFESLDMLNTNYAVILGMIYNFLPFMIFPIYTALVSIDKGLINAAKDLGCNGLEVFKRVILPLSIPGIISGIIFVFIPAVTSFIIPLYLGGGKVDMIGNIIERQFITVGDWNFGSALSLFIMSIMIISTMLLRRVGDKYEK
ncbi:MAG: ABC transporter permease [Bacilli bacterium]